jgi:hypothetical protein
MAVGPGQPEGANNWEFAGCRLDDLGDWRLGRADLDVA